MSEFEQIVLNRNEIKTLRDLSRNKFVFYPYAGELAKLALVSFKERRSGESPIGTAAITDRGRRYLLYLDRTKREKWIPIWISVIALFISAVALLGQLGILPVPRLVDRVEATSEDHARTDRPTGLAPTIEFFSL